MLCYSIGINVVVKELCKSVGQRQSMIFFTPRLLRVEAEYRVGVGLQNRNGVHLPGSCSGVMTSISQDGACLILSRMLLEGRHLFFPL